MYAVPPLVHRFTRIDARPNSPCSSQICALRGNFESLAPSGDSKFPSLNGLEALGTRWGCVRPPKDGGLSPRRGSYGAAFFRAGAAERRRSSSADALTTSML